MFDMIDNFSKEELVCYLNSIVASSGQQEDAADEHMMFLALLRRIIAELTGQRVYKVSTVDASRSAYDISECEIKYYASLHAAKKELKRRYKKQRRNAYVAAPDEIQEKGLHTGLIPSLHKSTLSNCDCPTKAPGRFKFYEVRMLRKNKIVPVQFLLTMLDVVSAKPNGNKPTNNKGVRGKRTANSKVENVISFEDIKLQQGK